MTESSPSSPTSEHIYTQLAHYRTIREANDPITTGWVTFMQDLGLADLMPEMAEMIDPTQRDDSEFLNYDCQGAFDRYAIMLRAHLLHKTRLVSDMTDYHELESAVGEAHIIRTSLYEAMSRRESGTLREITIADQTFEGDLQRTTITIRQPDHDFVVRVFQAVYPHALLRLSPEADDLSLPLKGSMTSIFQGI